MFYVIFWIVMAVAIGLLAKKFRRNPYLWGLYALVIWPIALVNLLIVGESNSYNSDD